MKNIEVVAAVIYKEGEIFTTQRGYGEFEGLWEFPGGKIEAGEDAKDALVREIQEELGVLVKVNDLICTTEYDYPTFHLTMHCFLCNIASGEIELREHKSACWLTKDKFNDVEWLPADLEVIEKIKKQFIT
jgi:8-oxo-dGTP diphosphatase